MFGKQFFRGQLLGLQQRQRGRGGRQGQRYRGRTQ